MSTTLSASTKDEYRKAAEGSGDEIFKAFNSDDEGVREGAMAALMNTAPKLKVSEIQMRALQTSDANGINIHQTAAITAWNKDALRQAFEELKSRHANEPATMSTLEPFMTARNRGKIQPRYVNNDSGMLDLMTDLSNRSFLMHQQNSLDASQNLARELYEILQSPEFYNSPGILNMMKPKDMVSTMMTAELFNGNHAEAFQSSLRYNMGQLAIGDLTRTPAYDKEQDLHRMAQDIMKQSGVSVTDEAAFNDILHGLILQRRNKNPLRPKAINSRGRSQSRATGRSANANRNRGQ